MPKENDTNEGEAAVGKSKPVTEKPGRLDKNIPAIRLLENFYRGKSVLSRKEFLDKGKKSGSAAGYLATDRTDDHVYMMKSSGSKELAETFLTEYLCAGIYQRILYNRAPDIELVQDTQSALYFRSKFLTGFKAIAEMEEEAYKTEDFTALESIEGFPKVIAACVWLGESDTHANNLGVSEHISVKIDHGHSGVFQDTEQKIRKNLNSIFNMGRRSAKQAGGPRNGTYTCIKFEIAQLRSALEEITKISDDEVEKLIGARTEKLKQSYLGSTKQNSLSNKEKKFVLQSIEEEANRLIQGLINQRNIIKDDFLKSLEVIEIIGQGDKAWNFGEWLVAKNITGDSLIIQPIEQLINHALAASSKPEELKRLGEITQYFYDNILKSLKINSEQIGRQITQLNLLEQSKNWEALYEFEQSPTFEQIKTLQQLETLQNDIKLKTQSLNNGKLEQYDANSALQTQKIKEFREEQMAWFIENHTEESLDFTVASQKSRLRDHILAQNQSLNNLFQQAEKKRMLADTLMYDEAESVKILFYPTADIEVREDRLWMLKILLENKLLYDKYKPLDQELRKKYLLTFMKNSPEKVLELLSNDQLDQKGRQQMELVLTSPTNNEQINIAIAVKKAELETLDVDKLREMYQEPSHSDVITKRAIFQLYPENEDIRKMATKDWTQWLTNASPDDIDDSMDSTKDPLNFFENELISSLLQDDHIIKIMLEKEYRQEIPFTAPEPSQEPTQHPEVVTYQYKLKRTLKDQEKKPTPTDHGERPKH